MRSWSLDDILSVLQNPNVASNFTDSGPQVPDVSAQPPIPQPQPKPAMQREPQAQAVSDPMVREYLTKKYDLGNYTDENRQKLVDESSKYDLGGRATAALAALGAGFQGRDSGAAGSAVLNRLSGEKQAKLDNFDKMRDQKIQGNKIARDEEKYDPNSASSMAFKKAIESNFPEIAKAYGENWANVSAADQDLIFEPLKLKENVEARKQAAWLANQNRSDARQEKIDEKMMALETPYGRANTIDDAKQLKSGHEAKSNFDAKVEEMIKLREKHGGGAILNREDVARGKQLSKDLLLEYKNMAKLGVLSQADEAIINAIIPADPLEYNSPLAAIQGQDPTLNRLKKFKADSDKDFANKVQTRIRGGKPKLIGEGGGEKTVAKKQYSPSRNQTKIIYSDGTEEIVDGQR